MTITDVFAPNLSEEQRNKSFQILRMQEKSRFQKYLNAVAHRESGSNPRAINTVGAMGKYQFTEETLDFLGFGNITADKFRRNPDIFPIHTQEKMMLKLLKSNQRILQEVIDKYSGTVHNGILITKSGILAAAHLAGAFGVKRYFKYNGVNNPSDVYGTSLKDYLKYFSGYKLNFLLYNPLKES